MKNLNTTITAKNSATYEKWAMNHDMRDQLGKIYSKTGEGLKIVGQIRKTECGYMVAATNGTRTIRGLVKGNYSDADFELYIIGQQNGFWN